MPFRKGKEQIYDSSLINLQVYSGHVRDTDTMHYFMYLNGNLRVMTPDRAYTFDCVREYEDNFKRKAETMQKNHIAKTQP